MVLAVRPRRPHRFDADTGDAWTGEPAVKRLAGSRDTVTAMWMLAPSLVVFAAFVFYPLGRAAFLGLHQNDFFGGNRRWVGLLPVRRRRSAPRRSATRLGVTLKFTLLTVPLGLVLGLGLAVLADKAPARHRPCSARSSRPPSPRRWPWPR